MGRKGGVLKQKKEAPKDFQKDKRKVGKTKKPAQNDTKTDYRVKQVQMPSQSMLIEKGDEVTHRKQGLLELLAHTQHHSSKVRRDAFHGLRELCDTHEGVLRGNLSRLFDATSTAAIDAHADVRVAFKTFQTWLLEALPQGAVVAFAPALALHVRSALSHVSSAVREDGLLLLELYLAKLGGGVLGPSETERVIETLCHLNSQAEAVLRCLCRLLRPPLDGRAAGALHRGDAGPLGAQGDEQWPPQVSLHAILQSGLRGTTPQPLPGDQATPSASSSGAPGASGSPVWTFCLRAWQQAGAVPLCVSAGGAAEDAALQLCLAKLQCATALEFSMEGTLLAGKGGVFGEFAGSQASSRGAAPPSVAQLQELLAMRKRGEWPLMVEPAGKVMMMAESANARLVRAVCLLAVREQQPHQQQLPKEAAPVLGSLLAACIEYANRRARVETGLDPSEDLFGFRMLSEAGGDVTAFGRVGLAAHAVQCLDLLWVCAARYSTGLVGEDMWAAKMTAQLVEATVNFVADGDGSIPSPGDMWPITGPLVLALPLVAALLGIHPDGLFSHAPAILRMAWPHALAAEGAPCLAGILEQVAPGAVDMWVSACPRLLWALRDYEPSLSEFVLALLFELAKKAVHKRPSLHERLFSQACPYLLPSLVGIPDVDLEQTPPPLVALPHKIQKMATKLLGLFPKISPKVAEKLTQVVCLWSAMGSGGRSKQGCGALLERQSCCRVMGAVLRAPGFGLELRLRAALSVLSVVPRPAALWNPNVLNSPEKVALHLADIVAAWLMDAATIEGLELGELRGSSLDAKRRIALEEVAWPLSRRLLERSPLLAPRALCFLFFCALRLSPCAADVPGADGAEWVAFLQDLYGVLVRSSSLLCPPAALDSNMACIWPAISGHLCDPARGVGTADVCEEEDENPSPLNHAGVCNRLATMLVTVWMRAVPLSHRARAYELLVRLCATQLLLPVDAAPAAAPAPEEDVEMQAPGEQGASAMASSSNAAPETDVPAASAAAGHEASSHWRSQSCAAILLTAGVRYRNENGLSTAELGSDTRLAAGVTTKGLQELRDELAAACARCPPDTLDEFPLISLGAALPML